MDGINPCAFAVMLFFIAVLFVAGTTMSFEKMRSRILIVGGVYILAVFVAYMLIGLVLIKVFTSLPFPQFVAKVGSVIMLVMGIINIKDYFWPGRGFSLGIPVSRWETIRKGMHTLTIPATFGLGLLVGVLEFPCTGGIYMAILAVLAEQTRFFEGLGYLVLYNLVFVLPLVVILVVTSSKRVYRFSLGRWKQQEHRYMKLVSGVFMISLGALLILVT